MSEKADLDRPPSADPGIAWPEPPAPWRSRWLRRPIKRTALWFVDHSWFGLTPLEKHIVIAGFPRGGTTLVQAILESCTEGAKVYGAESRGLNSAKYALRSSPILITKRPDEVFCFEEIRAFYQHRKASAHFVLICRDPRAVLTSHHHSDRSHYYVTPRRWRAVYEHWRYQHTRPDVLPIRYEELVTDPQKVEAQLTAGLGVRFHTPMADFHKVISPSFDGRALNGVRPLDPKAIGRWRSESYRDRLRTLLEDHLPELPKRLIEMGYETDTKWTRDYL